MRISELSEKSGVTVPTIKYYLREGLLFPGRPTARNQAAYDERHLHRLRLIRALRELGGVPVECIRAVLDAVDDPGRPLHDALGTALYALPGRAGGSGANDRELAEIDALLTELGWRVSAEAPARRDLAAALGTLRRLGRDVDATTFLPHARAADALAAVELASLDAGQGREAVVEQAVTGTVVYEAALAALRRLAHEHHSATGSASGRSP